MPVINKLSTKPNSVKLPAITIDSGLYQQLSGEAEAMGLTLAAYRHYIMHNRPDEGRLRMEINCPECNYIGEEKEDGTCPKCGVCQWCYNVPCSCYDAEGR